MSEPLTDDWRHSSACKDLDPADFDGLGTQVAHDACADCPVRLECDLDANQSPDPIFGVYRAGRFWGDDPEPVETPACNDCGRTLRRYNDGSGLRIVNPDLLCPSCRRLRSGKVTLHARIEQWRQYTAEGLSTGQAAGRMGIEDHTLLGYLREGRRKGLIA